MDNVILPKNAQKELIDIIVKFNPKEIWIFGSFAKGEAKFSSDIDLFIVQKKNCIISHKAVILLRKELNEFGKKYGLEIDVFYDTKKGIKNKILHNDEFYISVFSNAAKIYDTKSSSLSEILKQNSFFHKIWLKFYNFFKTLKEKICKT